MRRTTIRPFGQSTSAMRLASMLMALLVLWALYARLKDPATWQIFVEEKGKATAIQNETSAETEPEQLALGPNDQDEAEVEAIQELFELVIDRAPLKSREMNAYWRLMDWSRTQPLAQLEQRALDDVPFTQLWEQPAKYRGRLIRLRLHVRRVLQYDSPENPGGIAQVCEAWGWTDESRSFPYVVVFPAPLAGLPIGTDVRTEIVFVGYFLKVMTFTAFDHGRGAPLLVGRARVVSANSSTPPSGPSTWMIVLTAVTGVLLVGGTVWRGTRTRQTSSLKRLPDELSTPDAPDAPAFDFSFGSADAEPPSSPQEKPVLFDVAPADPPPPTAGTVKAD